MNHPLLGGAAVALALALTTCTPQPSGPTASTSGPAASSAGPSAPGPSTATTASGGPSSAAPGTGSPSAAPTFVDALVLAEPSASAPAWRLAFALPYGDAPGRLGTSPGGENVQWGPSYGVQVADGTWWFLDGAHLRLAHFSDAGVYLDQVALPASVLADGYVKWQRPLALADGTVVLLSTAPDAPGLLLLSPDRSLRTVTLARHVGITYTDGRALYGFDETNAQLRVDPLTGTITPVSALVGTDGRPFVLRVGAGSLTVQRGAASRTIPVRAAAYPDATVHPAIEVASAADGTLNVLVTGMVELSTGDVRDVAGLVRIDGLGRVRAPLAMPTLTSEADPGDGSRLGVRSGDSTPWIMVVDAGALRVYRPA